MVLTLCKHLNREKFLPIVASPGNEKVLSLCRELGVQHFTIPFRGMRDLASVMALRNLVESEQVDLVHAHLGITTVAASLALVGKRIPLVISRHFIQENYTHQTGWRLGLALGVYKAINSRASAIIGVSEAVTRRVLKREKPDEGKMRTIPNGIEVPPLPQGLDKKWEDLAGWVSPMQIVCISRMNKEKRVGVLLEALALLKKQGVPFKAHLVGTGELLEQLKEEATALNLEREVVFTGFVGSPWPYLEKAHLMVHPAEEEPFGLALLEAMTMALPVVAVASGGPREIVVAGETGVLVEKSDPGELFRGILKMQENWTVARKMGLAGRKRVVEQFSAQAMTEAHEGLYEELLG